MNSFYSFKTKIKHAALFVVMLFAFSGIALSQTITATIDQGTYTPNGVSTVEITVDVDYSTSPGNEWADWIEFEFPANFTVADPGGNPGTMSIMDAANIIGFGNDDDGDSDFGDFTPFGGPYTFSIEVTETAGSMADLTVDYTVLGDGFGCAGACFGEDGVADEDFSTVIGTATGMLVAAACELENCPADQTVDADAGLCSAAVTIVSPTASADCIGLEEIASEDFDDLTGNALPAGWSVDDGTGTPGTGYSGVTSDGGTTGTSIFTTGTDVPGGADNDDFDGNALVLADDPTFASGGTDNILGLGYVATETYDLTGAGPYTLSFNATNQDFAGSGDLLVDVWDGTAWVNILTVMPDTPEIDFSQDVTAFGNADFAIRFGYDDEGAFAWGAGFDNILLTGPAPAIVTNDFNGTDDASGDYPVGTTVVTFTTVDPSGAPVTCQTTVTVEDNEAPEILLNGVAADDTFEFDLGPDECTAAAAFTVEITDNCMGTPVTASNNTDAVITNSVRCTDAGEANQHLTVLDLDGDFGVQQELTISDVDFGVFASTEGTMVTLNLYSVVPGDAIEYDNFTLIGTSDVTLPALSQTTFNAPIDATIDPLAADLVLELVVPNSLQFVAGFSENLNQGVAYLAGCGGSTVPEDVTDLGFTDFIYFQANGVSGANTLTQTDATGFAPGDDFPAGTFVLTFEGTDGSGNAADVRTVTVTVNPFDDSATPLAANDQVQLSLGPDGETSLFTDQILEGGPYSCGDNFILTRNPACVGCAVDGGPGFVNFNCNDVGETITVMVTNTATGNSAWGTVLVEDKIDPVVVCEDATIACTDDATDFANIGQRTATADSGEFPQFDAATFTIPLEISAPAGSLVEDVTLELDINHTWVSDLDISLVSPEGTVVNIFNDQCGTADDVMATFNDAGDPFACSGGTPAIAGNLMPDGAFADFLGEEVAGEWSLIVTDDTGGDPTNINNISLGVTYTGLAVALADVTDNCEVVDLDFVDVTENGDCDGPSATITRTFTATDASGNTGQCVQIITVERPTLDDVTIPADITISCVDYNLNNGLAAATVTGAGVPTINGNPIVNGSICNISSTLASEIIIDDICEGTFKIRREWLVVDWCAADGEENEIFQVQYVKVIDETGPNLLDMQGDTLDTTIDQSLLADLIPSVSSSDDGNAEVHDICEGFVNLPALSFSDACSSVDNVTTSIFTLDGELVSTINANGGSLPNVPLFGTSGEVNPAYNAVYTATDECGNVTTYTEEFETEDQVSPTCVLDEITQIAIGTADYNNDGVNDAQIDPEVFDDGSYDNCGEVHFLADRPVFAGDVQGLGSLRFYSKTEVFDCSDIGEENQVFVMTLSDLAWNIINDPFQAPSFITNSAPGLPGYNSLVPDFEEYLPVSSIVNGLPGQYNVCMVEVLVEDKLAPFKVEDVEDATITCDDFFTNFQPALDVALADGDVNPAVLTDAFGDVVYADNCDTLVTRSFSYNVNSCGQGTITRTFEVEDPSGNQGPTCTQTITVLHINDWSINFPADVTLDCVPDQDELEGEDFGEPTVFDDDCELIAISVEDQLFDVVPDACYKIIRTYTAINWCVYDGTESSVVNNNNPLGAGNDDRLRANCLGRGPRYYEEGGADSGGLCSQLYNDTDIVPFSVDDDRNNDDGIIVYTQVIKVNDDIAPVITDPGTLDFCIDGNSDADGDCDRNVNLPELDVTDCSDDITVTYTVAGLGTGLNFTNVVPGTYTVTVTAIDNCGNQSTIEYDFVVRDCKAPTPYCVGGLVVELMPMDEDGDGQPDSGMVEIWANDFNAGSFDNCTDEDDLVFLGSIGEDNFAEATADLVFDCSNQGQNDIFMYVQDEAGNVDYCLTTVFIESVDNVCGNTIDELTVSGALATENDAPVAGVDVSLNNGTATVSDLNGAYSLVAENGTDITVIPEYDVYDNSVTTFDLLIIRKHILTTELLDSPYKMIAADVNNSGTITAADLVIARQVILGMATSYTNNNAWAFVDAAYEFPADWTLTDGYPAVASFNNVSGSIEDVNFVAVRIGDVNGTFGFADEADERNSMIIRANNADLVAGQEFTVEFTSAEAVLGYQFTLNFAGLEVVSIDGNKENFGQFANAITTSFSDDKASDKLFAVTFRATENVTVADALALTSDITAAEAYSANGTMNVTLEFGNEGTEFALYQNTPNPFQGSTVIGFNLPEAGTATLTVTDISGKVLNVVEGDYAKGFNQVRINDLGATGVLYYQLDTQNDSAVRKMVVIE